MRSLVLMLIAHYASAIGNAVTVVTVPLYVLERTGSPLATGVAAFASTVPLIFAGAVGGVWVDRLGGRTMSIASDLASGVVIAAVPLLDQTTGLPMPVLLVLLFGRTVVSTPAAAARVTLLRPLAEGAGRSLATVTSWYQAAPRLGLVIGAPLAALLVVWSGAATGLYIDGASFLLAALLVAVGVPAVARRGTVEKPTLRGGLAALRALPVIMALTAFVFVTNLLDDAFTPVILPYFAHEHLDDDRYLGWFIGASGVGAIAGTFGYPLIRKASRRWTLLGCFVLLGALRMTMGMLPGPVVMTAMCLLLGVAAGPLNPVLTTVTLEHVPESLQGRVFGVGTAVAMSGAPIGVLLAGWTLETLGLSWTLLLFGGAYLLLVLISLRMRSLRAMDHPPAPAAAVPT
jgi:MFS family permease